VKSYGEVRGYVVSRAGAVDQTIIEDLMVQSLLDINRDMGRQEDLVTVAVAVTSGDAFYDVPATIEKVLSILDADGCPMARHEPGCSCTTATWGRPYTCGCYSITNVNYANETTYKIDGTVITFFPTPTAAASYSVKGLGPLNTTLYDMDGQNRVWRWVNLPTDLHECYANRVLGMAIADFDPGRAQIWLGFSGQSFDAWKARIGRTGETAGEPVIMARNSRRRRNTMYDPYSLGQFERAT